MEENYIMFHCKKAVFTAIVLCASVFLIATGALSAKTPVSAVKAPDFILKDTNGKTFRLSDYKGKKPVMIIFSTTWCSACKSEIPYFKSLYAHYASKGLEIVNVGVQESQAKMSKFSSRYGLPYRVLLDESGMVSGVYEIRGVPSLVLVDQKGFILCHQCQQVEPILDTILKK
jgi:peroxiredoxin